MSEYFMRLRRRGPDPVEMNIAVTPARGEAGWLLAAGVLAARPAFGILSMARLRTHPDAVRMAGGRR